MPSTQEALDRTDRAAAESGAPDAATPSELKRQLQVSELQVKLEEAQDKLADIHKPWWRTAGSVTVVATLLAAVLPVTEFVKGWLETSRTKITEAQARVEAARNSYLDRSLNGSNQERLAVLRFIIKTSNDETLKSWAREEQQLVEKQIQDELEIANAQAEVDAQALAAADIVASLPPLRDRPTGSGGASAPFGNRAGERADEELRALREKTAALQLKRDQLIANLTLPPSSTVVRPARTASILWVDRSPLGNVALRHLFETAGTRVVTSSGPQDAERLLAEQHFDLIIWDGFQGLRPAAGDDLLKSVRERDPAVPFIVYSAGAGLPVRRTEAMRRGASGSTDAPAELARLVGGFLNLDLPGGER